MSEMTKEDVRDRLGNIDQIRDIIFGAQIRQYNQRLDQLESTLSLVEQTGRDRLEQVKLSLSRELKQATDAIEKRVNLLSRTVQDDQTDLRQQIDRIHQKLSGNLEVLDATIDQQSATLRAELRQTTDGLQEDLSALRELVLEELDRRFMQLQGYKVSKDDMAEALFELGMRLKGTAVVPELKKAAETEDDAVPLLETRTVLEELTNGHYSRTH